MRVFVSYRRDDAGGRAGRLCDSVAARVGATNVFHDVRSIAPGHDVDAEIGHAIDACDVVLVVIGRTWTTLAGADGRRRLDDPGDYVALEVAAALRSGKLVVPVLVDDAAMPPASALPEAIAALATRQAASVRDLSWHHDVEGLLRRLEGRADPGSGGRRRRTIAIGAVAAAVVVAFVVVLVMRRDGRGVAFPPTPPGCPPVDEGWTELTVTPGASARHIRDDGVTVVEFRTLSAAWRARNGGTVMVDVEVSNVSEPSPSQNREYFTDWADFGPLVIDGVSGPETPSCAAVAAGRNLLPPRQSATMRVGFRAPTDPTGVELLMTVRGGATLAVTTER